MITKTPDSMKIALVKAVKEYALTMYGRYGWDYVVECLSDKEIASMIGDKVSTSSGAIKQVYAKYVRLIAAQQADTRWA